MIDPPYATVACLKLWIHKWTAIANGPFHEFFLCCVVLTNHRAQLQTLASDWMRKYIKEKLILQNTLVNMFSSLCKTPTNNSFKGTTQPSYCNISVSSNSNSLTCHMAQV